MRYATVCSGIEAPTAAWEGLGWEPVWFSEIEPFPCAVLAHHYPDVPNLGDMTKIIEQVDNGTADDNIGLLAGGTPCQSFSVAGLRRGLDDDRGNLMLEFVRIINKIKPRWVFWENVPGVLSSGRGRDFGAFVGALAQCGYGVAYRVLDAQYYGVPQRRRRVFVVGYLGDWRPPAAVLFEQESLRGHTPPRGKKAERVATFAESSFGQYHQGVGCLRANGGTCGDGSETIVIQGNAIRPDSGCEGKGWSADETCYTLTAADRHAVCYENHPTDSRVKESKICPTVRRRWGTGGGNVPFVAFTQNTRDEVRYIGGDGNIAGAVCANAGVKQQNYLHSGAVVRRLTPLECERLQGFADGYTRIPKKILAGRPKTKHYQNYPDLYAANPDGTWTKYWEDGARYAALGNSMAVPVVRWIGERIDAVDKILKQAETP